MSKIDYIREQERTIDELHAEIRRLKAERVVMDKRLDATREELDTVTVQSKNWQTNYVDAVAHIAELRKSINSRTIQDSVLDLKNFCLNTAHDDCVNQKCELAQWCLRFCTEALPESWEVGR